MDNWWTMTIVLKKSKFFECIFAAKSFIMALLEFIRINQIRPADAVVLRKKFLGMVDHYAVFVGYRGSQAIFVANYRDGVREVNPSEINRILDFLQPIKIDRFPGNEVERKFAIRRALSRIGERAYNYVANNCEHFKNWVHFGENYSKQVEVAGNVSLALGAGVLIGAVATENPKAGALGVGLLLTGLVLKNNADDHSL